MRSYVTCLVPQPVTLALQCTMLQKGTWGMRAAAAATVRGAVHRWPGGNSRWAPDLHIFVHGELEARVTRALAPDVGRDRAEDAHGQLQDDDEPDLEVQEVVVRACAPHHYQVKYPRLAMS